MRREEIQFVSVVAIAYVWNELRDGFAVVRDL